MTLRDTHPSPDSFPGDRASAREPRPASAPGAPSPGGAGGAAPEPPPVSEAALGLRLRVWLACLAGALIPAAGFWWVAGTQLSFNPDPPQLLGWLVGVGGLGLIVAIGFALWLDHGIVAHLRGLTRGLASGRVQELRGLPSASGWGELSELTEWAQVLITRQRLSHRAGQELERLESSLGLALQRLEAWRIHDRWDPLPVDAGSGGELARELNDSFARTAEVDDQNLEAARRVKAELIGATAEARDSAAQAERGFVEATALLTTVRELQRLAVELKQAAASPAEPVRAAPASGRDETAGARPALHRQAVEAALEELIASSNQSVEHLGAALRRVQEIATQVQVVSQRATLVALHAVTIESRLPREERRGDELSRELRMLTGEVRAASQQADSLAAEVERETRAADERMRGLRERVAPKLAPLAETAPAAEPESPPVAAAGRSENAEGAAEPAVGPHAPEPSLRLLERVREMIQDATQKGERLSAAGERASRTAERLVRRLEDETREVEGLMVRLAPAGRLESDEATAAGDPASSTELRLLDSEGAPGASDESRDDADAASDPGRMPREERP